MAKFELIKVVNGNNRPLGLLVFDDEDGELHGFELNEATHQLVEYGCTNVEANHNVPINQWVVHEPFPALDEAFWSLPVEELAQFSDAKLSFQLVETIDNYFMGDFVDEPTVVMKEAASFHMLDRDFEEQLSYLLETFWAQFDMTQGDVSMFVHELSALIDESYGSFTAFKEQVSAELNFQHKTEALLPLPFFASDAGIAFRSPVKLLCMMCGHPFTFEQILAEQLMFCHIDMGPIVMVREV